MGTKKKMWCTVTSKPCEEALFTNALFEDSFWVGRLVKLNGQTIFLVRVNLLKVLPSFDLLGSN